MTRCTFLLPVAVLIFLCLPVSSLAQKKEKINQDWVQSDVENTRLISKIMPVEHQSVEDIATILGANTGIDVEDLGFGAKRINIGKGAGYTSLNLDIFTFNNTIAWYKMSVYGDFKSYPKIGALMKTVWQENGGPAYQEDEYGIFCEQQFDSVFQAYKSAVAGQLGELQSVKIPSELNEYYQHLISPMVNSNIGEGVCGYGGGPIPGKTAIDVLVKANRIDLIENVLRGYNPGGRIYAVLALLKMEKAGIKLPPQTQVLLKKVLDLPVKLSTCSGCIIESGLTAKDIVRLFEDK